MHSFRFCNGNSRPHLPARRLSVRELRGQFKSFSILPCTVRQLSGIKNTLYYSSSQSLPYWLFNKLSVILPISSDFVKTLWRIFPKNPVYDCEIQFLFVTIAGLRIHCADRKNVYHGQAKIPSPKAILHGFLPVTVRVRNSYFYSSKESTVHTGSPSVYSMVRESPTSYFTISGYSVTGRSNTRSLLSSTT